MARKFQCNGEIDAVWGGSASDQESRDNKTDKTILIAIIDRIHLPPFILETFFSIIKTNSLKDNCVIKYIV